MDIATLHRLALDLHGLAPRRLSWTGRAFPPLHYVLQLTRQCNMRCVMCQDRVWQDRRRGSGGHNELTTEQWRDVIRQTGRWSLLTLTGGEPSQRQDFFDLLAASCAIRRVHCLTNGVSMADTDVARLAEEAPARLGGKGLNVMGFSLHGPSAVHDALVGRNGAFGETIDTIVRLATARQKAGKRCPYIHVTAVVTAENLGTLPQLPAIVAEAGADVLNLARKVEPFDLDSLDGREPWSYVPPDFRLPQVPAGALDEAVSATVRAARRAGVRLRLPDMPMGELARYYDGGVTLRRFECGGAWSTVLVGADGGVYPCLLHRVGDVRSSPLRAIWNGPAMRTFRQRIRERLFPMCQGCCFLQFRGARRRNE